VEDGRYQEGGVTEAIQDTILELGERRALVVGETLGDTRWFWGRVRKVYDSDKSDQAADDTAAPHEPVKAPGRDHEGVHHEGHSGAYRNR